MSVNGADQQCPQPSQAPMITWEQRERLATRNRALLDRELLEKRLVFVSGPYEAHVQFSNFCNMSCIMCWDGENPPLKRMDPVVLGKVRDADRTVTVGHHSTQRQRAAGRELGRDPRLRP